MLAVLDLNGWMDMDYRFLRDGGGIIGCGVDEGIVVGGGVAWIDVVVNGNCSGVSGVSVS
jgi:hypothetical protein